VPVESVHEYESKDPLPELDHDTTPLGELPVTVAVHFVGDPAVTGEGEQMMPVEVVATTSIVTIKDPELGLL
jgi:hypothetical protein